MTYGEPAKKKEQQKRQWLSNTAAEEEKPAPKAQEQWNTAS